MALTLTACSESKRSEEATREETPSDSMVVKLSEVQLKHAGIVIGNPSMDRVAAVLKLQGTIDVPPQSMMSVSFPLGGYLKSTKLLPGAHVSKGEVLGVLEDMQFIQLQQDYLSAKEKYIYADIEFTRQQELNASKASSDKVYQQARTEMHTQRVLMNAFARKLELIGINPQRLNAGNISKSVNILSPINGYVSKVNVNIGKYTSPTDVLFELVNPKDIHLSLDVFEQDVDKLSVGQQLSAYTNSHPEKKHRAEIILISKNLDKDRMTNVHCHFNNFDSSLLPGMFMNAEVDVNAANALTVPEDAVTRWQNQYFVFVETAKGTFKATRVKPGNGYNGRLQVEGPGISENTRLATKNSYTLLMKMKNSGDEE